MKTKSIRYREWRSVDPINQGVDIFQDISKSVQDQYPDGELRELKDAESVIQSLIDHTQGLVIVDFMDSGQWYRLEALESDHDSAQLSLHWRDYRKQDEARLKAGQPYEERFFQASLYTLSLHFQSLQIINPGHPVFLLRGYALSEKEVKKRLRDNSEEIQIFNNAFFSSTVYRKINGLWQRVDYLTTPLYSVAILPKNTSASSADSTYILFVANIGQIQQRLGATVEALSHVEEDDVDQICEKANTGRRLLEQILKLECCYHDLQPKKPYQQLTLGPLSNLLKLFHEDNERWILKECSILADTLSHDSGLPVEKGKAKLLLTLVQSYLLLFDIKIRQER